MHFVSGCSLHWVSDGNGTSRIQPNRSRPQKVRWKNMHTSKFMWGSQNGFMLLIFRVAKWSHTLKCCRNVAMWPNRTVSHFGKLTLMASKFGLAMKHVSLSPGKSASLSPKMSSLLSPKSTALTEMKSGTMSLKLPLILGWLIHSHVKYVINFVQLVSECNVL